MQILFGNIEIEKKSKEKGNPYRVHGKFSTKEDVERYKYRCEIKLLKKVAECYKRYAKRL